MSNSFITNQERFLDEIIKGILPKTEGVDILVGYFYFSGYSLLSKELANKHLRILVGLDIDTQITNLIQEVEKLDASQKRIQVREEYFNNLVKLINETDNSDTDETTQMFRQFQRKIFDGTLEIHKTEDPCHAKMYLFSYKEEINENGEQPGDVITGSSNLSKSGLKDRTEINVRFTDKDKYGEGKKLFDNLWEKSIPIVDANLVDQWKDKVTNQIWIDHLYKPYILYLRVLSEYFNTPSKTNIRTPNDITRGKYSNLKYQTDAIQLALKAIENHNGAIIADVVGLGKSIIASTIASNLCLRTIVISPPHLKSSWDTYKDEFCFTGTVFSSGKISDALAHFDEIKKPDEQFLIIVDEAHRYRNEETEDYSRLHKLCLGNKVVLLTATPFNNAPADIFSLLKLFQIPTKSTLKTVDNLSVEFQNLINQYEELQKQKKAGKLSDQDEKKGIAKIAQTIRSIIGPLVIRRSRIDLQQIDSYRKDLKEQNIELVIPQPPKELTYDLKGLKDLYKETLDLIYGKNQNIESINDEDYHFKAARYKPIRYVPEDKWEALEKDIKEKTGIDLEVNMLIGRQINVAKFMRRLLVRRFESSVAAFKASLEYMIESSENILNWMKNKEKIPVWKRGRIPDMKDFYESSNDNMDEIEETFDKYTPKGFFFIDMKFVNDNFVTDLQSDIELLKSIHLKWFGDKKIIKSDPKLESFISHIRNALEREPNRKLVVFSEFADTVNYLEAALKEAKLPVFKYTSADSSPSNQKKIRYNFDASVKKQEQSDDYKVLVATDAISEGYNLHRAGAIFNYDIPYNPTRVIQRIGRINRINKKVFDNLYIYNYFPTDVGEGETRTKEISTLKMAMIHAIMGEDTKVLTSDEECNAFFRKRYQEEIDHSETESWDTRYRRFLESVKKEDLKEALQIPHRARTGRIVEKQHKGVIIFGKKGQDFVFKISNGDSKPKWLSAEEAMQIFEATPEEEPFETTKDFDQLYKRVKDSLLSSDEKKQDEKALSKAIKKIKAIGTRLPEVYFEKLLEALEADALSGYELHFINKIKPSEIKKLLEEIPEDYLERFQKAQADAEDGEKVLIISEELQ